MKIKIKNYQAIKKAELSFEPGVTVIVGNSNNGKSSIIRSIEAAINNKGGSSFINYDAEACQVNIEDNGQFVIWNKNRNSAKSFYQLNDHTLNKIGQKQLEEVGQLLNMPEVVINNEKFRLNFWKQLDYPFLVGSTHYQLFEFISKSKDQELIATLLNDTASAVKDSTAELNDLNSQINLRTKDILETENEIKALEIFEQFDAVHFSYLNRLSENIQDNLDSYKEAENSIVSLKVKVLNIENKIKKIERLLDEVEKQLALFTKLQSYVLITKKEAKIKKLENITSAFEKAMTKANKINKAMDEFRNKDIQINKLVEDIKQTEHNLKLNQTELDQFDVCPFCLNSIKDHGGVKHD